MINLSKETDFGVNVTVWHVLETSILSEYTSVLLGGYVDLNSTTPLITKRLYINSDVDPLRNQNITVNNDDNVYNVGKTLIENYLINNDEYFANGIIN